MNVFLVLTFALGVLGVLAICSTEPARRTVFEGMAILVLLVFSLIIAVVVYLGTQVAG